MSWKVAGRACCWVIGSCWRSLSSDASVTCEALGSSAPEILLSVVETLNKDSRTLDRAGLKFLQAV